MERLSNLRTQLGGAAPSAAAAGAAATAAATATATAGTEILWDTFGIPHIFAPDHTSLFFAYGFAQMEGHSELLIQQYAISRGCGAEFYGTKYLESDRWVRLNGISQAAQQWVAGQSANFGPLIESFAAGLNTWATEHAAELSPAASRVLPLSSTDVYAHCLRVIHYDWIISPQRLKTRLDAVEKEHVHGSNMWAVAPSRSATGNAMLLSNSHLQWGRHHTYMEVQLTAPGVTSSGAVWM